MANLAKQPIITPRGKLRWVFVTGQGRPNLNGENQYQAVLVLPDGSKEADDLIAQIEQFWEDNKPKNARDPKSMGYRTNKDGEIEFNFKTSTTFPDGTAKKVKIFDSRAVEVTRELKIGNGSEGRISGMMAIYDNGPNKGVTLYLNSIQLLKYKEYDGSSAAGFEPVEDGGFTADDVPFDTSIEPAIAGDYEPQPAKPKRRF
ncbi:ssDNA-binding protein [Nitratiruptor sp. SB155-2]|uniref:ssDNA-binding protein n=1 Tax=Nitratiruptor sp. (strain SB155-2) TaxID=387092 RepID=UPI0001586F32|nr:ssDNA-binding protein [Nitratiruptor sp. SB155-2]BAF69569.1 phage-related protein [Nitratiruptor sp. SB155-2]BAN05327.1 ssDNA binding protein [Nitratiruptor phage NrS-1]